MGTRSARLLQCLSRACGEQPHLKKARKGFYLVSDGCHRLCSRVVAIQYITLHDSLGPSALKGAMNSKSHLNDHILLYIFLEVLVLVEAILTGNNSLGKGPPVTDRY